MFLVLRNRSSWLRSFPRVRGDVPETTPSPRDKNMFSPRTRGCSPGRRGGYQGGYVFPAYAGMFLSPTMPWIDSSSFPRVRGDVPSLASTRVNTSPFSPRTRGCSYISEHLHGTRPVFPAYAGMFPVVLMVPRYPPGFSPRTRGCSHRPPTPRDLRDVFPAYAGMFLSSVM